jgi:L-threonylcarbamoyladenylate synthase
MNQPLINNAIQIRQATHALFDGGVIAYPTEGVFGLGCLPDDVDAVRHLLKIKRRSMRAGLILVAPDYELLADWLNPNEAELASLRSSTSHPVTWVVTAAESTPIWLTGGRDTLAVRITAHPVVAALCRQSGSALVSTSANRTGHRAALSMLQVRKWLGKELDYVVSGPLGNATGPSEIRRAGDRQVIRPILTTQSS